MGMFDRFATLFKRQPAAAARPRIVVKQRGYDAAKSDRLNFSWQTSNKSADADIQSGLDALRSRSRDLANNNEYARKYLQMVVSNVVGANGFTLQSLAGDYNAPDKAARDLIERAFRRFSRRGVCEITGQHSFAGLCRLLVETWARDGEFLVRKITGRQAGNEFGYALQVVEIDRLAVTLNRQLADGNRIIMGVEIDAEGRVAAYWLRFGPIDDASTGRGQVTRVPADQIYHGFRPTRPEQHRGVPEMHAVMPGIKMLDGYEEAAIVAARTGASKMGFFTSPDGDAGPLSNGTDADTGDFITEADPGTFDVLPPGYQFQEWNPDYPHANYGEFMKARLRSIASGLGVCYHTLANDLEGVNFSSIRSGTLEERDNWMVLQEWFIDAFLTPVFEDWLDVALLAGAITFPNGSALPWAKKAKFIEHAWLGRRWQWVDPLKDVQANIEARNAGFKSTSKIIAEQGDDRDEVWQQIAAENEAAAALDLEFGAPATPMPPQGDQEP